MGDSRVFVKEKGLKCEIDASGRTTLFARP